ncbi:MAG: hypothetical protein AAGA60_10775 [Cyanobacteria bacterium P01_E01_bin.42]
MDVIKMQQELQQKLQPYLEYDAIERKIAKLERDRETLLFEIARDNNLPVALTDTNGNKRLHLNWQAMTKRHVNRIRQMYAFKFPYKAIARRSLMLEREKPK